MQRKTVRRNRSRFDGAGGGLLRGRSLSAGTQSVAPIGEELYQAAHAAGRIAAGDLSIRILLQAGFTNSLMYAMNRMRESLSEIVAQVRSGTDAIAADSLADRAARGGFYFGAGRRTIAGAAVRRHNNARGPAVAQAASG